MKNIFIILFLTTIGLIHTVPCNTLEQVSEEKTVEVPNPLWLEKEWWKFFDVPADLLPGKIDKFRKEADRIQSVLTREHHEEAIGLIDQINSGLKMLQRKKSGIQLSEPLPLQFLQAYTIPQLFEIQERIFTVESEIEKDISKIESIKISRNLNRNLLDKHILVYQELPESSYERLIGGLHIIDARISVALSQHEISILEEKLEYLRTQKNQLLKELANAKIKITFQNSSISDLTQQSDEFGSELSKAETALHRLERKKRFNEGDELQNELQCCLIDSELFAQQIRAENFKQSKLMQDLQIELFKLTNGEESSDSTSLQEELSGWKKILSSSRDKLRQWKKQLEQSRIEANHLIAESLGAKDDSLKHQEKFITDLHLELTKADVLLENFLRNIHKSELLYGIVENQFIQTKHFSETWGLTLNQLWKGVTDYIESITSITLFRVQEGPITVKYVFWAILVFTLAWIFSKYFRRFLVSRKIVVRAFSSSTEYIVLKFIHYGIILIGFLIALSFFGLDYTKLTIIAGAVGVGIGFGMQSMVSNVLAGFMLLLNKYIKVGDVIKLENGTLGRVVSIHLQNTQIETFDGENLILPNSKLTNQQFVNWTMYGTCHRFRIPFEVAYGTDKELVRNIVIAAIKNLPYVVKDTENYPNPEIWFQKLGESALNFELIAWVDLTISPPYGNASSSLLWEVDSVLQKHDIQIPFPQNDVYIKEFPNLKREELPPPLG